MPRRPPPFAALRAVEAASRHRSYTAAAIELGVTHSAVSQAVRRLEHDLGVKLFVRRGAAMHPTAHAEQLSAVYARSAHSLEQALEQIGRNGRRTIWLGGDLYVLRYWLAPHIAHLSAAFPDQDFQLADTADLNEVDIVVRLEAAPPGVRTLPLPEISISAYAQPALAATLRNRDIPAHVRLLPDPWGRWDDWLAEAGFKGVRPSTSVGGRADISIDLAIGGAGLALIDSVAALPMVSAGLLTAVSEKVSLAGPGPIIAWRAATDDELFGAIAKELARLLAIPGRVVLRVAPKAEN